jgi:ribokinase
VTTSLDEDAPGNSRTAVAVVGSANLDIVVSTERLPQPGETVLGRSVTEFPGGKGLNQAVASARLAPTAFIGAVGSDRAGDALVGALRAAGVNAEYLKRTNGDSGAAYIAVAADGENSIVVITGANASVTPADVTAALLELDPDVVVTQLETPVETVLSAAEWARIAGKRWVFNPSPLDQWAGLADDRLLRRAIASADPLIVNAGEARELLGELADVSVEQLARQLSAIARSAIVTDGASGAHVALDGQHALAPGRRVTAVDTTGAGDWFTGTVAAAIADGYELLDAARMAADAAATLVSIPRRDR